MKVTKNIPHEIDYNLFKWLKRGDRIKIAQVTKKSESMVRATLSRRTYNEDIIRVAMVKVVERMKNVLEIQAEAKRLQQLIN